MRGCLRGVIAIARIVALLSWGVLGLPVWITLILFAMVLLILVTVARVITGRRFSIDRQLLAVVARSYPNGFRTMMHEFDLIYKEMDQTEPDVYIERTYFSSTCQTIGLFSIAAILICVLYFKVDIFSVSQQIYESLGVVALIALTMASVADYNKKQRAKASTPAQAANKVPD